MGNEVEWSVEGRTVLVTGAAGRIGRFTVAHLACRGATVVALSLDGAPVKGASRTIAADTTQVEQVREAVRGVDAVVHLAALPHRDAGPGFEVYSTNVVSTYAVLSEAGEAGVKHAVIASSINRYGLSQGIDPDARPPYYPIDDDIEPLLSDWYSLSKLNDENTGAMAARRWGMDVVALRFPFTSEPEDIAGYGRALTEDPGVGAVEGWSYLDVRDAARAIELGLTRPIGGFFACYLAAPTTASPYRTEDLLSRYAPDTPVVRRMVGREVPMDLYPCKSVLGFEAEHVLDLPERDLPLPGVAVGQGSTP